jgi:hypothetical protein
VICNLQGHVFLDSLAVEAGGKVCVATILDGGITVFDPDGSIEHHPTPESMPTNICFGGAHMREAWVTASSTGKLYKARWPRPGLTLNFGIATVAGVFAGSLVTALATGRFHLEGYSSPRHMLRSAGGAALMGIGGVMAFGCSIGQGLTGVSTLALGSFVAVAGILLGTTAGLRGMLRVQPFAVA